MSDTPIRLAFEIDGLESRLHVVKIEGTEGLNALWSMTIDVASEDAGVALDDVVGRGARLALTSDDGTRTFEGIVGRIEQTDDTDQFAGYSIVLSPTLKRLELGRDCRVFAEVAVPDVVRAVLAESNVGPVRFALRSEYPVLEHCIQYRESSLAFVSRLMEAEGIFYFFEETDDGPGLVIGDGPHAYTPSRLDALPFRSSGGAAKGEHVRRLRVAEELSADRVTLRGRSFKNPTLALEGGAEAAGGARIEVYDDLEGLETTAMPDPAHADRRARLRLEQLQLGRVTARASTNTPRISAGHTFALTDHPREAFNRRYLATEVHHRGSQPLPGSEGTGVYGAELSCIPAAVAFRPRQSTPRPRGEGAHAATVVGPKGEEIYTDELGRIRIQFHWDRRGKLDERSSCWIRVAQLWAGSGFGSMHVPRVGSEVLVDFLGGDLDRPIVVGGLYHATNVPPYGLPQSRTVTTIKTSSTPGGEGSNELRFEDARGLEEVYLHAERDLSLIVEEDRTANVGKDDSLSVRGERTKTVGQDETQSIGRARTTTIGAADTQSIGGDQTITVGANATHTVGGDKSGDVAGNVTEVVGKDLSLSVGGAKAERVVGASAESVAGDKSTSVEGNLLVTTGAAMGISVATSSTEEVEHEKTVNVGTRMHFVCGNGRITIEKNGAVVIQGTDIEIRSDNPLKLQGQSLSVRSSGPVNLRADGAVKVKGSRVNMN